MTRKEKLEKLKKEHISFYSVLEAKVPTVVNDPDNANEEDINIYNFLIKAYAGFYFDYAIIQNFSF